AERQHQGSDRQHRSGSLHGLLPPPLTRAKGRTLSLEDEGHSSICRTGGGRGAIRRTGDFMSEIRQTPHRSRAYTSAVEFETAYRAVESRDGRFDGRVFCGAPSTRVYCRPICPVPMPRRDRVRFFATAAAAEDEGFRACRRCRPEASPDSPDWDVRADLVGRGLRLIA